ncbi:MAG: hypothetical protein ACI4B3_06530 [Prevotella sp.]
MTKIKNLEMAEAISNHSDVTVGKAFFGLCEKALYVPTGSRVKAEVYEFSQDNGERLAKLLTGPMAQIEKEVARGSKVRSTPIGNMRAEVCKSADGNFLAIQLFRFADFHYNPFTEFLIFTGNEAEMVGKVIG